MAREMQEMPAGEFATWCARCCLSSDNSSCNLPRGTIIALSGIKQQ